MIKLILYLFFIFYSLSLFADTPDLPWQHYGSTWGLCSGANVIHDAPGRLASCQGWSLSEACRYSLTHKTTMTCEGVIHEVVTKIDYVFVGQDPCNGNGTWNQATQSCLLPLDCSITDSLALSFSLPDDLPSPLTLNIGGCGYTLSDLTLCSGGDGNWFCSSTGTPTGQLAQPNDYTPPISVTNPLPDTPPNAPPNPTTTKETTPLITGTNPLGEPTTELTTTEETTTPPRNDVVIEDATIEIITASGTRVRKITKTTTTMKANGSIRREIVVEYIQASQTTTTISVPKNPGLSSTTTSSTKDGTSGTTTETTTTNPDGSSTTESSSTGGGEPDEFPKMQEKGNNQFDSYFDNAGISEMADGLGSDDPGLFSFSSPMSNMSSGCQLITTNFGNKVFTFPGNDGCQRLEQLKDIFAFVLYVLTAYSIFEIAIRRPV